MTDYTTEGEGPLVELLGGPWDGKEVSGYRIGDVAMMLLDVGPLGQSGRVHFYKRDGKNERRFNYLCSGKFDITALLAHGGDVKFEHGYYTSTRKKIL